MAAGTCSCHGRKIEVWCWISKKESSAIRTNEFAASTENRSQPRKAIPKLTEYPSITEVPNENAEAPDDNCKCHRYQDGLQHHEVPQVRALRTYECGHHRDETAAEHYRRNECKPLKQARLHHCWALLFKQPRSSR